MVDIFRQLTEIFLGCKTDDKTEYEAGDETDYETDDEQSDTTDMPAFESEESDEKRRNQKGEGLKILTPDQILSRLPISLAQLKAENNSEKRKKERQKERQKKKATIVFFISFRKINQNNL